MDAVDVFTGEVVKVPFFTQRYHPLPDREVPAKGTITVQSHQDTEAQVQEFLIAGRRLQESRGLVFDSDVMSEEELDAAEPGIGVGADFVDVERVASDANARLDARAKEAADAAAAKAKAYSEAADAARVDALVAAKLASMKGNA